MAFKTNLPSPDYPIASLDTGALTDVWYRFLLVLWNRSGASDGTALGGSPGNGLNTPATSGNPGQYLTSGGAAALSFWTTPPPLITDLAQLTNSPGYVTAAALTPFARLNSPALTGSPTATTSPVDTNNTGIATNAFVLQQAGSTNPIADQVAAVPGTSLRYSRADHAHPFAANIRATQFTAGTATWTSGATIPSSVQPNGSLYSNTAGGTGARLYVSNGATWAAVGGV